MAPDAMGRVLVRSTSDELSHQPKSAHSRLIKPRTDLAVKISVANVVPDASDVMADCIPDEIRYGLDGDRLRREVQPVCTHSNRPHYRT